MFLSNQSPHDGHVFYDHVEGHHAQRPAQTQKKPEQSEPVNGKGLHHSEDVHVDVNTRYEGAEEVHEGRTGDGTQGGEEYVGNCQRHRDPRVARTKEEDFVLERQRSGMDDEHDALEPAFALLDEVP